MASATLSLDTLIDDIILVIIEQLLDEENPALVSVSNKHHLTMQQMFPNLRSNFSGTELHNPPDDLLFNEIPENMDDEPQNMIWSINRDVFGYHNLLKLRAVSKSLKQQLDKLPLVYIRSQLDQFYRENIPKKERDAIMLGIRSEIHIAELRQKWPRMLNDYLRRSTSNNKEATEKELSALYKRAKVIYNERCEDHNGQVYGKASLLELEFIDVNNEPLKIQLKLVHCWDVREANWYTQIFIYALNRSRPVELRPKRSKDRTNQPPKNCLMQLWKERGCLRLTYFNAELTRTVCQELSINESFWISDHTCLLLEFLLLVAGESKFTHFVPIAMKRIETQGTKPQSYDWLMFYERNREPASNEESYLTTVNEFKNKFLLNKIPHGKLGQRYLLNAKVQLDASHVEHSLKASSEPIAKCIESISHCYDVEVTPNKLTHLNSFFMKAIMKTRDGGSFVLWLAEKMGTGYHPPCDYVTLRVMPLNVISAAALGLELYGQGVVYYHFFNKNVVVNTEFCQRLIEHLSAVFYIDEEEENEPNEQPTNPKKRKASVPIPRPFKKRRTEDGAVDSEPSPVTILSLFETLIRVRVYVMRRPGAWTHLEPFCDFLQHDAILTFARNCICKDWHLV